MSRTLSAPAAGHRRGALLLSWIALAVLLLATAGCSSEGGFKTPTAPVASPVAPAPTFGSALGSATSAPAPGHFSFGSSGDSEDDGFDSDSGEDSDFDSDSDSEDDSGFDDSGDDSEDDSDFDDSGDDNSGSGSSGSGGDDLRVESDRFRGRVTAVDVAGGGLMLNDGFVVVVGAGTFWKHNGDLFSLLDVETAVLAGRSVRVDGEGSLGPGGVFAASEIRARVRGRGDGGPAGDTAGDFESRVLFADRVSQTLQLANGLIVAVDSGTLWSPRGDLFSVRQIERALRRGEQVRVEGSGALRADGAVLAGELKAESDGPDVGGDDGFEGLADQFEGRVTAVSSGSGELRLASGLVIRVDRATLWSPLGDLFSLGQTELVVKGGAVVRAEGDGTLQSDGTVLASTIKVEVDD